MTLTFFRLNFFFDEDEDEKQLREAAAGWWPSVMQDLYCLSAAHQPAPDHEHDGGGGDDYDGGEDVENDLTCIKASHVEGIEQPHL